MPPSHRFPLHLFCVGVGVSVRAILFSFGGWGVAYCVWAWVCALGRFCAKHKRAEDVDLVNLRCASLASVTSDSNRANTSIAVYSPLSFLPLPPPSSRFGPVQCSNDHCVAVNARVARKTLSTSAMHGLLMLRSIIIMWLRGPRPCTRSAASVPPHQRSRHWRLR